MSLDTNNTVEGQEPSAPTPLPEQSLAWSILLGYLGVIIIMARRKGGETWSMKKHWIAATISTGTLVFVSVVLPFMLLAAVVTSLPGTSTAQTTVAQPQSNILLPDSAQPAPASTTPEAAPSPHPSPLDSMMAAGSDLYNHDASDKEVCNFMGPALAEAIQKDDVAALTQLFGGNTEEPSYATLYKFMQTDTGYMSYYPDGWKTNVFTVNPDHYICGVAFITNGVDHELSGEIKWDADLSQWYAYDQSIPF